MSLAEPITPYAPAAEKFCPDYASLIEATGIPLNTLQAIKRFSHGADHSPFRGRGSYPSWIKAWLAERPWFVPTTARKIAAHQCTRSDPRVLAFDRSHEPRAMNGSRNASPAGLAPQPEPAA